ncbi:hypothetical protein AKO1_001091 [Acrasis kona]|uniref:NFACT RNA-binding domain-containing protein n=1 Tax=Acrasis kona TaxID=1008807 RepID=A0AAW2ZBL1_9EUKA
MVRVYKTESGRTITVGKDAKENDKIRAIASQKDVWFHLENVSSPHVVLAVGDEQPSRDDLYDCATLVKHFSKQKKTKSSSVIYTTIDKVKNVKEKDGMCQLRCSPQKMQVFIDEDTVDRLMDTEERSKP